MPPPTRPATPPRAPARVPRPPRERRATVARFALLPAALLAAALATAGCDATAPARTPTITPGSAGAPREVNLVARDYAFVPPIVDLVPGETVVLRVVNGGLDIHEAVVGGLDVQLAWEAAEAEAADPPPGPTPAVSVPPELAGLRVVVDTGERVDVTWTVPPDAAEAAAGWFVGCHIPGHWERGMVVPVRFVGRDGVPLSAPPALPVPTAAG